MKKKPSLQQVINRAKQHPYKSSVSYSNTSISQNIPVTNQASTSKKKNELVSKKVYLYIHLKKHFKIDNISNKYILT